MEALAAIAGLAPTSHIEAERPEMIVCTGPERVDEALDLGRIDGVPVVAMGQPGERCSEPDLVVTTPQFDVPGVNVVRMPFALSRHGACPSDAECGDASRTPFAGVLLGGDAGPWKLDDDDIIRTIRTLRARMPMVLVLTSQRTPAPLIGALHAMRSHGVYVDSIDGAAIPISLLLSQAQELSISADSVSMISEAVVASRRTSIIPIRAEAMDVDVYLRRARTDPIRCAMPGDLERFWHSLEASGPLDEAVIRGEPDASAEMVRHAFVKLRKFPLAA